LVKEIYLEEKRPPVQNENEYSLMVDFLFSGIEEETLEQHRAVLKKLKWGREACILYKKMLS